MQRSPELASLYQQMMGNLMRNDPADQFISTTEAVSIIGTDPTEWFTDRATIVQMFDSQRQATGEGLQVLNSSPQAWEDGDLGWVIDQPTWHMPNGKELQVRVTSIFHRENGSWKGVHQHVSIGIPNDQVEAFAGMSWA
jgi:ketosteroid isomerase-like protein